MSVMNERTCKLIQKKMQKGWNKTPTRICKSLWTRAIRMKTCQVSWIHSQKINEWRRQCKSDQHHHGKCQSTSQRKEKKNRKKKNKMMRRCRGRCCHHRPCPRKFFGRSVETKQDMRVLRRVELPSKAQQEAHRALHLANSSWCRICVKSHGKDTPPGRQPSVVAGNRQAIELDLSCLKMTSEEKAADCLMGCHKHSMNGFTLQLAANKYLILRSLET